MIRRVLLGLVLLAAVAMMGCFDYQEFMVLNKDGSGTLEMRLAMDMAMIEGMEAMAESFGAEEVEEPVEEEEFISKNNIEKYLKENDAGVKLLSYEELEEEGMKVWKIKYSFEDLNSIHHITGSLNEDFDQMDDFAEDEPAAEEEDDDTPELSFAQQDDGTWLFERGMDTGDQMPGMGMEGDMGMMDDTGDVDYEEEPYDDQPAEEEEEMSGDDTTAMGDFAKQMEEMSRMMSKVGVKLTVQFPGEVVESNATKVEGNTATWEYKMSEMGKFPDILRAVVK